MPNWVLNRVIPMNSIAEEFIKEWCLDEKGQFTFNKLIPMPEVFNHMSAPLRTTDMLSSIEEFTQYIEDNKDKDLYLDYSEYGFVSYSVNDVKFEQKYTPNFLPWIISQCGDTNWWDWSINHWSCKWDASNSVNYVNENNNTVYEFNSPWCYPSKFIVGISKACPFGEFIWHWNEEQDFGSTIHIQNGHMKITEEWDSPEVINITTNITFEDGNVLERDISVIDYIVTPFVSKHTEWIGYLFDRHDDPINSLCDNVTADKRYDLPITKIDKIAEIANLIYLYYIEPKGMFDTIEEYVNEFDDFKITREVKDELIKYINEAKQHFID